MWGEFFKNVLNVFPSSSQGVSIKFPKMFLIAFQISLILFGHSSTSMYIKCKWCAKGKTYLVSMLLFGRWKHYLCFYVAESPNVPNFFGDGPVNVTPFKERKKVVGATPFY